MAAWKCFEKFCKSKEIVCKMPVSENYIHAFINWAVFERSMAPATIKVYVQNIATLHKLMRLDDQNCKSFLTKTLIRGAENLNFYKGKPLKQRYVMTLPLLRLFGHELCRANDWSANSKSVVWTASLVGFFGSFRFAELLSKDEEKFNPYETLLWSDVSLLSDGSAKILNKIPKTRKRGGESISLFPFEKFGCCPIKALKKLKSFGNSRSNEPVFTFSNGTYLTNANLNEILRFFLSKKIGNRADGYSCQSFRGALPSALAANPALSDDLTIKKWGRWHSSAFEKYTRLSHIAKKSLFEKFVCALDKLK